MRSSLQYSICACAAILVFLLSSSVTASLRHKSSKLRYLRNKIDASGGAHDSCKMSEPCGWALYVPGTSPRKIYKYTRNTFCSCSGGNVCSLTRDALQQNSFVFYCRPKETSRYRFPDGHKNWKHILIISLPGNNQKSENCNSIYISLTIICRLSKRFYVFSRNW